MECIFEPVGEQFACVNCGKVKNKKTRRRCNMYKGAGDVIARITKAVGISACNGCNGRRHKLNRGLSATAYANARFIFTRELVNRAVDMVQMVPPDTTAIVGIPRSGMIPAAAMAAILHLPLYSADTINTASVGSGARFTAVTVPRIDHRMLLVDDTVMNGNALRRFEGFGMTTAAVFVNPRAETKPDITGLELPAPHLLEWNLFNSGYVRRAAFDMDGVICRDQDWTLPLDVCRPKYVPRRDVLPAIITGRLESDRKQTVQWLTRYGVRYDKLIMFDGASEDRAKPLSISKFKATEFNKLDLDWFIESDPNQAREISVLSGAWTICPTNGEVY